jgi:hypothetical protein
MSILSGIMGIINVIALIILLWNDETGASVVYLGTLLFYVGVEVQKALGSKNENL